MDACNETLITAIDSKMLVIFSAVSGNYLVTLDDEILADDDTLNKLLADVAEKEIYKRIWGKSCAV